MQSLCKGSMSYVFTSFSVWNLYRVLYSTAQVRAKLNNDINSKLQKTTHLNCPKFRGLIWEPLNSQIRPENNVSRVEGL